MTKQEFIASLRQGLAGLPQRELEEHLGFYSEMIDDRIEEGHTEEEAVADLGAVENIAAQIIAEIPFARIARERIRPKRALKAWELVLLALGAPIWLSLLIAVATVILSIYVVLWSAIASLWAVFASFAACALGGAAGGLVLMIGVNGYTGILLLAAGIVCAGCAILLLFGCKAMTKMMIPFTKKIAFGIKKCFMGKEKV